MASALSVTEGTIPFGGAETWYRIVGSREVDGAAPMLALHGGPGAAHDYLESMQELAHTGRRVIFYDQLGCGRSPYPEDPSKWTVELFVQEVDAVREALGLDEVHLVGQSWGGMLGMEYALTQPSGLRSLVICDSPSSMRLWVQEANRLREDLPPEIQQTLLQHEAAGTTQSDEYQAAIQVFYDRHVCRVVPNPDYLQRSLAQILNQVYLTMNGPSEFHVVGTLKDWDITPRLGGITVPTLVISGAYDEATPLIARTVHEAIPGSEWVLFEESSHMPHVEEPERFRQVVGDWMKRFDPGA
jgi:proline-specific peptidase